jgi:hypothetical protein
MAAEWINITELHNREGLTEVTIRRMVKYRDISYRRRGRGKRAALEFNYAVVREELKARRETPSYTAVMRPDPNPTLLTVLNELRELKHMVTQLLISSKQ